MKKVLLIVIDALSARHVRLALSEDRLPNLASLIERGQIHEECTSIFPSITPAATASIVTGRYPSQHGIPGAFFYDADQDRVHYFGDDIWAILREGVSTFFNDFLVRLNDEILAVPTLYQRVERAGGRAACLNYLILHGDTQHQVDVPRLLRLFPTIPWHATLSGPELLCLGDFVASRPRPAEDTFSAPGGLFKRFGFQDDSTAALLVEIAEQDAWRDLTVAYFPDNDYESHSDGPMSAIAVLENFDSHLGRLFAACGGIDAMLTQIAVLITGDHSQSDLAADKEARGIEVEKVLDDYPLVPAGEQWTSDDQLMVCPNLRACQIYLRRESRNERATITNKMLTDPRIDQVIWRSQAEGNEHRYHVATHDAGELVFWRCDDGAPHGRDDFGNEWKWNGALATVRAEVTHGGRLAFSDYPNAFERIASSFVEPAGGDLWVTAHIGYEFALPGIHTHNAGSHGSLHTADSTAPIILSGAPESVRIPPYVRTLDATELCLRILGIEK